jgi:hypothetical protein
MPGSIRENDTFVRHFVAENNIGLVLDVGTGQGTYSDLLKNQVEVIDGIEVWKPYIEQYDLNAKYDALWEMDARKFDFSPDSNGLGDPYDLVIFGDVLEHMTREESMALWYRAGKHARYCMLSVPIVHYPQGAEFGNPHEVHVQEHLTPEAIRADYGPFEAEALYNYTGTFIRRFN